MTQRAVVQEHHQAPRDAATSRGWRNSLEFHIPQLGNLMHNVYNREFRRLGVTRSQAVALVQLGEYGTLSQSQLAKLVGVGKAATGTLVQQMEDLGLISRQADPTDARNRLVSLAPTGAELVEEFGVIAHNLGVRIRAGITPAERRLVADVLLRMRANLESIESEAIPLEG